MDKAVENMRILANTNVPTIISICLYTCQGQNFQLDQWVTEEEARAAPAGSVVQFFYF
jgi:hypothetical protein